MQMKSSKHLLSSVIIFVVLFQIVKDFMKNFQHMIKHVKFLKNISLNINFQEELKQIKFSSLMLQFNIFQNVN